MSNAQLLTDKEQALYIELKRRELAVLSPLEYGVYCSDMVRFPHVEYADTLILAAINGNLYKTGIGPRCVWEGDHTDGVWVHPVTGERAVFNIALNEPPRHGKSFHISEHLPAWYLTLYKDQHVHLASYEHNFASSWGAKARDHVEEHPELGMTIRSDARANAFWRVKGHTGSMKTAGAGGPLTGTGRHLGVIDDLLKNAEEAMSSTVRQANIDWYLSTWKTRKEPHPARQRMTSGNDRFPDIFCVDVSVSTRWNMGDLNGWLKENENDEWYFVNLPAIAFEDDTSPDYGDPRRCVIGRKPGEPLCAERFSLTALMDMKTSGEGSFWFQSLYQGVPRTEDGGIIQKPFRYYRKVVAPSGALEYHLDSGLHIPAFKCLRFATVDLAATIKARSDYTVFAVWDVTPGPERKLILVELHRMKLESADHEAWIRRWSKIHDPRYVGIEDKTFGTTLIQTLRKRGGVKVRSLPVDRDKVMRALPFGYQVLEGNVFFPAEAEWLDDYEEELLSFPNGTHDDMVDVSGFAAMQYEAIPSRYKTPQEESTNLSERVGDHVAKKIKQKQRRRVKQVRRR